MSLEERMNQNELKLQEHENRLREVDRRDGVLASVDSGLSAVANGQKRLFKLYREEKIRREAADIDLKKSLERVTALPLAIVTFFASQLIGVDPKATIGLTLITVFGAYMFPERMNKQAKLVAEALENAKKEREAHERATIAQNMNGTRNTRHDDDSDA